jgi:carbon monoxide dehydrogenase subunit G
MELQQTFTVPVPVDRAWDALLDPQRIAPCMPGASLDAVEGDAFTGNVKIKLGPINLSYRGQARRPLRSSSPTCSCSAGPSAGSATAASPPAAGSTRG